MGNISTTKALQFHQLQHMAKEPVRVVVEYVTLDVVENVLMDAIVYVAEDIAVKCHR